MTFAPDPLDPDDDRPPYVQVASSLSAAIRTRKLAPGEKLPSHKTLTELYGFARATIQRALRDLEDEGLVVSRKGSGVYVRNRTERPSGLRPYVEQAFSRDRVTIDFAGFSSETLHGALQEPLDKIRVGRLTPKSITMRILVPDMSVPQAAPVRLQDGKDDQRLRDRMRDIMVGYTRSIRDSFSELVHLGLVTETHVKVRVHSGTQFFKLYVINGEDVFFGYYPVRPNKVVAQGEAIEIYDLLGKDTVLFHHSVNDGDSSSGAQQVQQATMWFDSVWETIGREFDLDAH
ncbi:GntR family transcriptional regulator [Streptomyces alkaliterrae]|uniref:GntR family transcriptional regulator n=1 Tax=Streptomyces alkaliterrae TaxID=2213162 RepID=A0A5P0YYM8_9ACTN|nr:winged helix-turn-helix domain-containing protein [Streptomyces alkaliterrae]MBB1256561.1 GntR family transcriptional regulator [Streptomyces alkaliterrae]MBB1262090.1 GntR family transcriptional regulator [Streptomyces alkaliterrae]MQS04637.1 GntR family transcriptional regulator [Streptomyces alkaliterrae]